MSKIVRMESSGPTFAETLPGAKAVRDALLRRPSASLNPADARREAARKEGFEIGRQEGYDAGRAEAMVMSKNDFDQVNLEKSKKFSAGLQAALDTFDEEVKAWYANAEESLADLAIEIARRAIGKELEATRESVVAIAHEALSEVTEGTKVRLRINPLDASEVEARKKDLMTAFSNVRNIEVVEDRSIEFGCRLETDAGLIDARVEDFLARIVATVKKER